MMYDPFTWSNQSNTYKLHRLENGPSLSSSITRDELLGYYREMSLVRKMEIAADGLYKQKEIRGFLHLYNGQEAVAAGLESALTSEDHVITAYREHAFLVSRRAGGSAKEVLAELTGRATGCSKGKGGSMHMYNGASKFYGGNGIVGAQIPLGTGLAFAAKYQKTGRVAMAYMGDGAANQGQVYEAYNMAKIWKLPIIYVVENNEYAMGTAIHRASATPEFYTRGDYIPGLQFNGMDVVASRDAGRFAVEYAKTHGPILLEAKTYRYVGHSMSDPGTSYRDRSEIQQVRDTRDPITQLKARILDNKIATEEELDAIDAELKKEIAEAVTFATESPSPAAKELFTEVYTTPSFVRAVEYSESFRP
jgi:pyruvate dehydrogenase E1 component alpha subunit